MKKKARFSLFLIKKTLNICKKKKDLNNNATNNIHTLLLVC